MPIHRNDQSAAVRALRNAAPYMRLYKGKVFVIKAGGAVFGFLLWQGWLGARAAYGPTALALTWRE